MIHLQLLQKSIAEIITCSRTDQSHFADVNTTMKDGGVALMIMDTEKEKTVFVKR